MTQKAQLLWDFRGPDALKTAEHHIIHLKEFALDEALDDVQFDLIENSAVFVSAVMVVSLDKVAALRTKLNPHRGKRLFDK